MDIKQNIVGTTTPKKHKSSHRHSEGKSSTKKNPKSGIRSDGAKAPTGTVKKEVSTPVKKKPMISDSDSENDFPLVKRLPVKEEQGHVNSSPVAPGGISSATVGVKVKDEKVSFNSIKSAKVKVEKLPVSSIGSAKVKSEKHPSGSAKVKSEKHLSGSAKVKSEKRKTSRSNGSEIPVAKRKSADMSSSKPIPKVKMEAPGPVSGAKRKKATSESEESDYEEEERSEEEDDEDFKPSSAKKHKKAVAAPKKTVATPRRKAPPTPRMKAPPTPTSTRKTKATAVVSPAKKSTPASRKRAAATASPVKGGRKKKEEEKEVWKWWEEEPHQDGIKWLTLDHKGPFFAAPYEPLPAGVRLVYDGKPMELSEKAEEAAGFFAKMLDHDYTTKDVFCKNFFQDWRKEMTREEVATITDFKKCDFRQIHLHYQALSEARKNRTKEEKLAIKKENEETIEEFGWCMIDGHKERIGNFKIEPPGLFRGRGDHPKQGRIKKRIEAESVIINIGREAKAPSPPPTHRWKEVQHDIKVTWLANWTENIQGSIKYVMLNPTSRLKAEKDWGKYETARKLTTHIDKIRAKYMDDWRSKEMSVRQRAVALYFIDKLALRAGNEKDTDESADTVGCCSLRVEHIKLCEEKDGKEHVIEFDFLGKDSIRYTNLVPVEKQVFKNVRLFMKDKTGGDDLFDRLTTTSLNKHLGELMENLSAKVFRTYNASKTLQDQLVELTDADENLTSKILSYNRANRAVAILCNHQRAPPKTFDQQMSNLQVKIEAKEDTITETKAEIKALRKEARATKDAKTTKKLETKEKQFARFEDQLHKLEVQATDKQENKEIALGTSKLNYLDPRISVAWCKKWKVPVEKIYNKTQRQKFAWAMDMADEDYEF